MKYLRIVSKIVWNCPKSQQLRSLAPFFSASKLKNVIRVQRPLNPHPFHPPSNPQKTTNHQLLPEFISTFYLFTSTSEENFPPNRLIIIVLRSIIIPFCSLLSSIKQRDSPRLNYSAFCLFNCERGRKQKTFLGCTKDFCETFLKLAKKTSPTRIFLLCFFLWLK